MFTWLAWRRLRKEHLLVNLKTGDAIRGFPSARRGRFLFLRSAEHIPSPDGIAETIPGLAVVDWKHEVAFYQILPPRPA